MPIRRQTSPSPPWSPWTCRTSTTSSWSQWTSSSSSSLSRSTRVRGTRSSWGPTFASTSWWPRTTRHTLWLTSTIIPSSRKWFRYSRRRRRCMIQWALWRKRSKNGAWLNSQYSMDSSPRTWISSSLKQVVNSLIATSQPIRPPQKIKVKHQAKESRY